jgi:hypothetical protein
VPSAASGLRGGLLPALAGRRDLLGVVAATARAAALAAATRASALAAPALRAGRVGDRGGP